MSELLNNEKDLQPQSGTKELTEGLDRRESSPSAEFFGAKAVVVETELYKEIQNRAKETAEEKGLSIDDKRKVLKVYKQTIEEVSNEFFKNQSDLLNEMKIDYKEKSTEWQAAQEKFSEIKKQHEEASKLYRDNSLGPEEKVAEYKKNFEDATEALTTFSSEMRTLERDLNDKERQIQEQKDKMKDEVLEASKYLKETKREIAREDLNRVKEGIKDFSVEITNGSKAILDQTKLEVAKSSIKIVNFLDKVTPFLLYGNSKDVLKHYDEKNGTKSLKVVEKVNNFLAKPLTLPIFGARVIINALKGTVKVGNKPEREVGPKSGKSLVDRAILLGNDIRDFIQERIEVGKLKKEKREYDKLVKEAQKSVEAAERSALKSAREAAKAEGRVPPTLPDPNVEASMLEARAKETLAALNGIDAFVQLELINCLHGSLPDSPDYSIRHQMNVFGNGCQLDLEFKKTDNGNGTYDLEVYSYSEKGNSQKILSLEGKTYEEIIGLEKNKGCYEQITNSIISSRDHIESRAFHLMSKQNNGIFREQELREISSNLADMAERFNQGIDFQTITLGDYIIKAEGKQLKVRDVDGKPIKAFPDAKLEHPVQFAAIAERLIPKIAKSRIQDPANQFFRENLDAKSNLIKELNEERKKDKNTPEFNEITRDIVNVSNVLSQLVIIEENNKVLRENANDIFPGLPKSLDGRVKVEVNVVDNSISINDKKLDLDSPYLNSYIAWEMSKELSAPIKADTPVNVEATPTLNEVDTPINAEEAPTVNEADVPVIAEELTPDERLDIATDDLFKEYVGFSPLGSESYYFNSEDLNLVKLDPNPEERFELKPGTAENGTLIYNIANLNSPTQELLDEIEKSLREALEAGYNVEYVPDANIFMARVKPRYRRPNR